MPPPAATNHVDGTAMVWADIAANIAAYRAWVNNVPLGDFAFKAVKREHLVKPDVKGFPDTSFQSTFQSAWWRTFGVDDPSASVDSAWGSRRTRFMCFMNAVGANERWRFPIGATIWLPAESHMEVGLTFDMHTRQDPAAVAYPNGAGAGALGGYFALVARPRSTGIERECDGSRRMVYPNDTGGAGTHSDSVRVCTAETWAAGWHDISLHYFLSTASLNIYQHTIGRVTMKIEAH